jgi:hypothetical protein
LDIRAHDLLQLYRFLQDLYPKIDHFSKVIEEDRPVMAGLLGVPWISC